MKKLHIVLHPTPGVGKSIVAAMLAEFLYDKNAPAFCIDANPLHPVFSQYYAFHAVNIDLSAMLETPSSTEAFIKKLVNYKNDIIIDASSDNFNIIISTLKSNKFKETIKRESLTIIIHFLMVGDNRLTQSINGINLITDCTNNSIKMSLWLNSYFGEIECEGVGFESSKIYRKIKGKIKNIVTLPYSNNHIFNQDYQICIDNALTMMEAIKSPRTFITTKQRITMIKREVFQQISKFEVV